MNEVEHLIISSTLDFSTDLVCHEMEKRGMSYFRLNRDCFSKYTIEYSFDNSTLKIVGEGQSICIRSTSLQSVYFRAPVFLRYTSKQYTLDEQVHKGQWSSFIRNLIIFDQARWVNHPVSTYRAENKLYQLEIAKRCGLQIPKTQLANFASQNIQANNTYIVKSLDTAIFYENGQEMFTYSTKIEGAELIGSALSLAPVIIQEFLHNKTDVRVTIVGEDMFAVSITENGDAIDGDWRKVCKDDLVYRQFDLPIEIRHSIIQLMSKLNLTFGGMDFAIVDDNYYFIEVNPTGEWGWLTGITDAPIEKTIVDYLLNKESVVGL